MLEGRVIEPGLRHPTIGKLFCQPISKWVLFESGKRKGRDGLHLSSAEPMIK